MGAGGRVGSSLAQHESSGSNSNTNKGPRLIGGVPIAEYEGSPRRYGRSGNVTSTNGNDSAPVLPTAQSLLASPSVYPPRPGFPQVTFILYQIHFRNKPKIFFFFSFKNIRRNNDTFGIYHLNCIFFFFFNNFNSKI